MNKLKIWANLPRVLPHIICYALNKQKRMIINKDIMARPQYRNQLKEKNFLTWELCSTLIDEAEFRNLFYMRIGAPRHLLNILLPKISSMRLSPHIGEGFCQCVETVAPSIIVLPLQWKKQEYLSSEMM